ncbi:mucoidy inhibitor MuiA family protein [Thiorhodospira sibirica]|uniref:mucoidy inhibitor MuiA family protein n=1 Tax=Thiorhodospira sibirica TaxID=154347 RepID=UPI00022C2DF4|nr:mucoidy inhibitor MuiA family protein [Thiorhodospira sibirica]
MRHSIALMLFTLALLWFLPTTALSMQTFELRTEIREVTIYTDRALVLREGEVEVPQGISEVLISPLPWALEDRFVQTSVLGAEDVLLLDTRIERAAPEQGEEPPRLLTLREELKALQEQQRVLNDEMKAQKQRSDFLGRIEGAITGIHPKAERVPEPAAWEAYLSFFAGEWAGIFERERHLNEAIKELDDQIKAVQAAINDFGRRQQQRAKTARIRVQTEQPQTMTVRLSYLIAGASWTPQYDIRVSDAEQSLHLQYRAAVRQQTGEDWPSVRLQLSTAQPSLDSTAPSLPTWWLTPTLPPPPPPSARMQSGGINSATQMSPPGVMMESDGLVMQQGRDNLDGRVARRQAAPARAEVSRGLTATTFTISAPTQIPADNTAQTVTIDAHTLDGDFHYVLVPARSQNAFLQIKTEYDGEAVLLPGQASIFHGQTLVGRAQLELLSPGETITLPLGISSAIQFERRLVRRFVESSGILGRRTKRITYEYRTKVENRSTTTAHIQLQDHIPVSTDERIRVNLRTPGEDHRVTDKRGELLWSFELAAGESKEVSLIFVIEHPEDLSIVGL